MSFFGNLLAFKKTNEVNLDSLEAVPLTIRVNHGFLTTRFQVMSANGDLILEQRVSNDDFNPNQIVPLAEKVIGSCYLDKYTSESVFKL